MNTIPQYLTETAFAVPGESSLIDVINPATGKSWIEGETLEQIRLRYPTAEIVNVSEWCAAKAARQDEPVTWAETTEEHFFEMLECLPPAYQTGGEKGGAFLVGEPWDHHATTGRPRFAAYREIGDKFLKASRPMTVKEFKELLALPN